MVSDDRVTYRVWIPWSRLNPCFDGIWSLTCPEIMVTGCNSLNVLILVLMEYGL